jgi:chromosome segregation ATPase
MIKKTIFAVGIAILVALFFFGRDAVSYVRTSAGYVKDSVEESVPLQFQIDRARDMVKNLTPEIRRNMHVIAKEEVEVEHLEKRIAGAEVNLAKDKREIMRLKADLAEGKDAYEYNGRDYTAEQVKIDLALRFDRYKTNEATLESLRQIHLARQKSLDAARQKLEGMLAKKRQLQVEVENLDARLQMVAAAKTTCDYQFDDSKLGRTKELIEGLQKKLDIEATLVNAEGYFQGEIPLDESAPENIVEQVSEYFGEGRPETNTLASDE